MNSETRTRTAISVALCTYNGARYLPEQLESLRAQTRLPDELVVCDDGSEDASVEIVARFAAEAPFPVRIYRNERNLGSTKNFEKAIGLCSGDLIALCDQDDIWLPEKLANQSAVLAADPSLGGVFSDAYIIDSHSKFSGQQLWELLYFHVRRPGDFDRSRMVELFLVNNVVTGATSMIRASIREIIGEIPESWVHDGWIAWMLVLYSRLTFVTTPLIQYRIHEHQQVGIDNVSIWQKFQELRSGPKRNSEGKVKQFEELRERWMSSPGEGHEEVLRAIEGKIRFMKSRSSPFPSGLARIAQILDSWGSYMRYAHGVRSMTYDIVFCIFRSASRLLRVSSNPT